VSLISPTCTVAVSNEPQAGHRGSFIRENQRKSR
jgi:hypothetical protein